MKQILYSLLKFWVKTSLYLYHKKITVNGLENVPKNKPVLFLPNHQNALIDILLLVVDCNRKPYFLARSDIFGNKRLNSFFKFLQMMPIYRIRDGRSSLKKNEEVFNTCAKLFKNNEAIFIFPEGNHGLKRKVRPLSRGFGRVLLGAWEKDPSLDIHIVPVGLNYKKATDFPDSAAVYFGESFRALDFYNNEEPSTSINNIKHEVAFRLQHLTTHIGDELNYSSVLAVLEEMQTNFLDPVETNNIVKSLNRETLTEKEGKSVERKTSFFEMLFMILNFPMVFLWKKVLKPKVPEPEFKSTFRFGICLIGYPIFYTILFVICTLIWNSVVGAYVVLGITLFNLFYVRISNKRDK